ncbi:hypothetical protein PS2015_1896 [Pseudohongiella spirulinae]|uniref:Peptidase M12B domain-containing protein n=2 Tax=Pseudohongiella spirulinae TaxID=1249552 RepID=A0A0S2KF10_9GAMM|nr:hypothetical protein PS2015_1896 [Pseudohongiella spirulinae]
MLVLLSGGAVLPALAAESLTLQVPSKTIDSLREGRLLEFFVPGHGTQQVIISHDGHYLNGDRVLRGESEDGQVAVILTTNRQVAFAEIQLSGQRWLFDGQRSGEMIEGRLYQPEELELDKLSSDYVLPADYLRQAQPLSLSSDHARPDQLHVSQGELEIQQQFSRQVLFTGQSAEVEVTLSFTNRSSRNLSAVEADVYFILEDSRLISAPACQSLWTNTRPSQQILRCRLPQTLAPGATRSISYIVRVDPVSQPKRLLSTVYVEQQRHDAWLNVVNDVVGQGSDDMLSAFNTAQAQQLTADRLGNVVIDVLALYTPDVRQIYGANAATRINQMFSVANQIFQDSGVGITLRPVYHNEVNYPGSDVDFYTQLDELTYGDHPAFGQVSTLRDQYGADLVVLFRPMAVQARLCGLANLGGYQTYGDLTAFDESEYAFSLVGIDCPVSSALVHEIGHNLGLTHSHLEDGGGGTFPFATGHAVDNQFATVMANPARFGSARRTAVFSSPHLDCGAGLACGVHHGDPHQGADAVRALNLVRFQAANYRPSTVTQRPARQVASLDGRATDAQIALAASVDQGLNYTYRVSPGQRMDINADFYIDSQHVGEQGQFHVLADLSAAGLGLLQLNDQGEIFDWDGSAAGLVPYAPARTLSAVEYLSILQNFQPLPELLGHPLVLFIAYQLPDTGQVIYTAEPLVVQIGTGP